MTNAETNMTEIVQTLTLTSYSIAHPEVQDCPEPEEVALFGLSESVITRAMANVLGTVLEIETKLGPNPSHESFAKELAIPLMGMIVIAKYAPDKPTHEQCVQACEDQDLKDTVGRVTGLLWIFLYPGQPDPAGKVHTLETLHEEAVASATRKALGAIFKA
jgi:hypothetical protein